MRQRTPQVRRGGPAALVVLVILGLLSVIPAAPPASAWGVSGPAPLPSVSAGGYMTCGLRADGVAACWGENGVPQNDIAQVHPGGAATPPAGVTFRQVNSGYANGCGVKTDETLVCWGSGRFNKFDVPAGRFKHVAPGLGYICALTTGGEIVCWGGDVPTVDPDQKVIRDIPSGQFRQLTVGNRHACALRDDGSGTVVCWGHSTATGAANPINVPSGAYISVNAASNASCAVRTDGAPVCWGGGGAAQRAYPTDSSGSPLTFTQVTTGTFHACGLRPDSTVVCWGRNFEGQASPVPTGTYTQVSAGVFHTCGMRVGESTAVCWGNNSGGRAQPNMTATQPHEAYLGEPYTMHFTMNPAPDPGGIGATRAEIVGISPAPTFSLVGGWLPPGLTLAANGVLSGTPTAAGSYPITVAASNGLSPPDCAVPLTLAASGDRQSMPCVPGDTSSVATATRAFTLNVAAEVPAPGAVSGRVTRSSDGAAVAGATVSVSHSDNTPVGEVTTDLDGNYTVANLLPGGYRLVASGTGLVAQTKSATVESGATTSADFSLAPRVNRPQVVGVWNNHWETVSDGVFVEWSEGFDVLQQVGPGYTVHGPSDSTCTGASLATGFRSNWLAENPSTTTPRTPSRIRDVEMTGYHNVTPGGTYHLRVAADTEIGSSSLEKNVLTCVPFVAELRAMDRSAVLGTVTAEAGGAPITGATVTVTRTIGQPGSVAGQATTNATGYRVGNLAPSSYPLGRYNSAYEVAVSAPGYASRTGSATTTFSAGSPTVAPSTSNATLNFVLNALPTAVNDGYTHYGSDTALGVPAPGVFGNDTDAENDALTAVLVNGPANGALTLNPDGSFTYRPNEDFVGTDSFTYRAGDATGQSAPTTVVITVGAGCRGRQATIVGTSGNDRITATRNADVIAGLGGNDILNGAGGNDIICGGSGNDILNAGGGDDYVDGGSGDDGLRGDVGHDTLVGDAGADSLNGDDGADVLSGGPGSPDSCNGGAGTDSLAPDHGCERANGIP